MQPGAFPAPPKLADDGPGWRNSPFDHAIAVA
jgi:hypothetical protein